MKFPFWATIFTIAGAGLLFSLGVWQLNRMGWKAELLANLDAAYATSASSSLLENGRRLGDIRAFERGYVEGVYLPFPDMLVGPQVLNKKPGFHVYSVLKTEAGIIFVNRGWVPLSYKTEGADEKHSLERRVRVSGMVRDVPGPGWFVADNEPERGIWRRPDPGAFAQALGLEDVAPFVFLAEEEQFSSVSEEVAKPGHEPVKVAGRPELSNNHFQYALFWFSMSGLLIIFYGLRFHNKSLRLS